MAKNKKVGRPNKYGEPTKVRGVRVPISKEKELFIIINKQLKKYIKNG
jgi:hypothetical protein